MVVRLVTRVLFIALVALPILGGALVHEIEWRRAKR